MSIIHFLCLHTSHSNFISKVWTLSISPNGKYVVTSGHDKTLRLWEKTQEPLVLDDERENEREKEEEEQLATGN